MRTRILQHLALSLGLSLVLGAAQAVRAQEAGLARTEADLSAKDILQRVRVAYASLSTYRDTGWTVWHAQADSWTNTFSELLGTRNYYCVEIITAAHPFSQTNRFWCDGLGHSSQMGGPTVFHISELSGNLSSVADNTCVPAAYFLLQWANPFTAFQLGPDSELIRKPDETVGAESCYVVARTTAANPATLWVSKHDFLIRRHQDTFKVETHENIATNEQFQAKDYIPVALRGR